MKCRVLIKRVSCQTTPGPTDDETLDLELNDRDHEDMKIILNKVLPNCPEKAKLFLLSQSQNLNSKPRARRWNAEVIKLV